MNQNFNKEIFKKQTEILEMQSKITQIKKSQWKASQQM
jgi:hypothetical protein